ncbi:radical SAM superfamily protein [Clostridium puniceum]|uniref:Radical SAM superfamily protein n=1 Tax=Clostridium puniceum TaxID=29367 RepID=A0A1S8TWD5_9CLOT|nr:RiPP maturation radical SAM C-methyltransferase [Clostridium puniceum]OOM82028.1 radical SAM superfamily protein [Clostridium puniceum]
MNDHLCKILDDFSDSEILLVVPPFSLINLPCIGLDILKSIADSMNVKTSILYSNMLFAEYIGVEKYNQISRGLLSMHTMLGERIFAEAAYSSMPCLGIDFLKRYDENFNEIFLSLSSIEEITNIANMANSWTNILAEEIANRKFSIVGVTTGHQQTNAAIALINAIKKRNSNIICTMGGSACDGDMAEGIQTLSPNIDYIFSGESEISWKDFLNKYKSDNLPNNKIITGKFLSNLDEILCSENTYRDYYNQLNYLNVVKEEETSFLYESSRGCWWGERNKCTFCGVNGWNKHYRYKSEQKVIDELFKMLNAHPKVKHIQMVDTLMPRNYFNKLLFTIKKSFPNISMFYEQRADLTLEQVVQLKRAGINYTQVGVEALSTNLLKLVNKGVSAEQNIKLLRYSKSTGLLIGWNLLTEIPNDKVTDWIEFLDLIPYIYHLNPPMLVRPLEIARFSPYFENPEKYNIKKVVPSPVYSEIFPESADHEKLAWLFTAEYSCDSKENTELKNKIIKGVMMWMDKWKHGKNNIPILKISKSNEIYYLEDSRFGNMEREQVSKMQATAALFGITEDNKEIFSWCKEKKVIYYYEGKYIPLATANPIIFKELKDGK